VGKYNKDPILSPAEVNAYKWVALDWLEKDMKDNAGIYTFWLKTCFEKLKEYLNKNSLKNINA
jgi:isopentenyl-diphosphate delta-isomerase